MPFLLEFLLRRTYAHHVNSVVSVGRVPFLRIVLRTLLLFMLANVILPPVHAESPQMQWEHVHPYPSGHWLSSVAWGPPGYVVVGWDREVLFSGDGQIWDRITLTNVPKGLWVTDKVCYYDGKYVMIGNPGSILWSNDGRNWNIADSETNARHRACAGGDGKYLIAGENHTLLVSTNAQDWETRGVPADFIDLVHGSNVWVALTGGANIYTSSDLENWTNTNVSPFGGPVLNSLCFGQGRFIAGGAWNFDQPNGVVSGTVILSSTNGVVWDFVPLLDAFGEIRDSVFANDQFVAVQAGSFLRSTNGETWEKITGFDAGGVLKGITGSSSGQFLAVGANGAMLASDDEQVWHLISSNPREYIQSVAYADGRFVAVGGSPYYIGGPVGSAAVLTSTNGYTWQASLTDLENQLSAVAYGNGLWVVCGDDGGIFTSTDGVNWTNHSLPPTSHDLHELVYGNGRFVAFGFSDLMYHSTNGVDWVSADTPLVSQVASARFINGRFIGVGGNDDGFIFSSADGVTWEQTTLAGTGWLEGVAYGKGRYVAIGRDVSAVSFDGTNWTVQPVPIPGYDIQFADGWFIAVGPAYGMLVSRDGIQWEMVDYPVLNEHALNTLAYGGGAVVVGGGISLYRGTLNDSEVFRKRLRLLAPAQLEFYGASGYEYRLEQSTNLIDWSPTSDWTVGLNHYLLWDVNLFQDPGKFWRAAGRTP